ncbi:LppX_LprAFG lipoprotein [Nocardioides campestrisoli]|uniref:LppX_LprAFG lipoprotein n=1 Tax=Nocardioides campestrisoli TaxID=2736757 RepID=UPI0015E6DC3C|nr:LppX_LprAFG lipoprotein [Nocardioides campestrisoli]
MRHSLFLRRAAAAAAVPLVLTALAACGSESGDDEPQGGGTAVVGGAEPGEDVSTEEFVDLIAAAAEAATSAHVTMEVDGSALSYESEGDIDYSTTPPSSRMTLTDESMEGEVESIQVDGFSYTLLPETDGKWLETDLSGLQEGLGGLGAFDPATSTDMLRAALTSVVYVGPDEVDGEDLERYSATVGTEEMMGEMLADSSLPLPDLPDELTYDIWFDQEGLQRRLEVDMGEGVGTTTMTMSDWGKEVRIEKPPADQITDSIPAP